jgi:hypothetical protein
MQASSRHSMRSGQSERRRNLRARGGRGG